MRRFLILTTLAAVLSFGGGVAEGITFFDLATGDESGLPDARSAAMGGTRGAAATGALAGTANPASLARLSSSVTSVSLSTHKTLETRATPAYDSFDGFLVESIYVLNDAYLFQGGFGAVFAPETGLLPLPGKMGLGVSFAPVRDFQYQYLEEVRDNEVFTQPRDRLIALNEIEGEGAIRALTFGAGLPVTDNVSVGAGVEWLTGGYELMQRTRWMLEGTEESSDLSVRSLSGRRAVLSTSVHAGHRLDLSGVFRYAAGLAGESAVEGAPTGLSALGESLADPFPGKVVIHQPSQLVLSAAYRPRAKMKTQVFAEASRTDWSSYQHSLFEAQDLSDVWDVRFGVEHIFYNGFPVRYGFHYLPSPRNTQIATTTFTFGTGFAVGPLHADLAFEVGNREYSHEDLFPDSMFGGTDHVRKDTIEENRSSAFVTLTYALDSVGG
ncbi:MAG: hypothetical protein QF819_09325 [Gemmatimonadota bacterium]|jgi:hypothetical protein|nr:hypothetical protein [Gemmatimonadota bacterium]MDP6803351.1 hypothetical protein [Gemmatimonadota bacterium]